MINVYTSESLIKKDKEYVKFNESFFLVNTIAEPITDEDVMVMAKIDGAVFVEAEGKRTEVLKTPYGYTGKEKLSTGCKTALNILHHKEKVFDCCECGPNVQKLLSTYFYKKEIDVDVVYSGYCFHIGEGSEVRFNGGKIIKSSVDYILEREQAKGK
jgi:hypothetical protein